jgi:hypothetical protein
MSTVVIFILHIVIRWLVVMTVMGLGGFLMTETKNRLLRVIGFIMVMVSFILIWSWLGSALYWSREV